MDNYGFFFIIMKFYLGQNNTKKHFIYFLKYLSLQIHFSNYYFNNFLNIVENSILYNNIHMHTLYL